MHTETIATSNVRHSLDISPTAPLDAEGMKKLKPILNMVCGVLDRSSLTLRENGVDYDELQRLRQHGISAGEWMTIQGKRKMDMVAQYVHLEQVCEMTLGIKAALIQHKLPERILSYQPGTGFPLPKEGEGLRKVFELAYGEQPLAYLAKPTVAGHTGGKMHVYEVTGKRGSGNKATVLVWEGREHDYSIEGSPWPQHSLALVPRVLKGLGVESVFTTFASGMDAVEGEGIARPQIGDIGYVVLNDDLVGRISRTDPGCGDQTLLGSVFGGPFQTGADRTSDQSLINLFESLINANAAYRPEDPQPSRHLAFLFDCHKPPSFEDAADWALARVVARQIQELEVQTPVEDRRFPNTPIAIAHGMGTAPELAAYHQMSKPSSTPFDRRLPYLAIVAATDLVDPRAGGGSFEVDHGKVIRAGQEKLAGFIGPVISEYFRILADL